MILLLCPDLVHVRQEERSEHCKRDEEHQGRFEGCEKTEVMVDDSSYYGRRELQFELYYLLRYQPEKLKSNRN
jgi:hypothetical protein